MNVCTREKEWKCELLGLKLELGLDSLPGVTMMEDRRAFRYLPKCQMYEGDGRYSSLQVCM